MARTVKINPWFYDGTRLADDTITGDIDGSSWTAGTPYTLSSGVAIPATSSTTTGIKGVFRETNAAAGSANGDVKVARIIGSCRFAIYVSLDDDDAAESLAVPGTAYGIRVANNDDSKSVVTLNYNDTSGAVFMVDENMSGRDSEYATTDSPGVVIGHYPDAVVSG